MAIQPDAFLFQQQSNKDTLSSWLDSDDADTTSFSQELQEIKNHLFDFETTPCSTLPIADLFNCSNSELNEYYQPVFLPELCETSLNGDEMGTITPSNGLSPPDSNVDHFCNVMTDEMILNSPCDVHMSQPTIKEAKVIETCKIRDDERKEDGSHKDSKPRKMNCKNLISERNRRKRLGEQLLSLRSLVPNITKMDKTSILVDALTYLQDIQEQTEILQKEEKEPSRREESACETRDVTPTSAPVAKACITEIDTEKIDERRYIVKITCNGGSGVGSDVIRLFECLDLEITYAAVDQQMQPQEIVVTVFIRVRKQEKLTEEKLKDCITTMAFKAGLSLQNT